MIGTFRTFIPLAWRNLWRNSKRTVITLIVVSVGLWSILFFNSFMYAWVQSSKDATLKLLIGSGQIHAVGYMDDPNIDTLMPAPSEGLIEALSQDGIIAWTSRLIVPGVVQSEYKTLPVNVMGVDPEQEPKLSILPESLVEGRYLSSLDDDGVVIGLSLAEKLKTGIGRRVILMSQSINGSMAEQSFDVVGIFDSDAGTESFYVFTGRAAGQKFIGVGDQIAQISFVADEEVPLDDITDRLEEAAPELDVRSWRELSVMLATMDQFMGTFVYIWLAVVFSMMAIGIINTQLMAVFERTYEFGLLRALGMKPRLVLLMMTFESAFLVGIGVLIGVGLFGLTTFSTYDGIDLSKFAAALEMFQGGQILYLKYHPDGIVLFSLIIWILGILVTLWPARRATKLSPVEAMRKKT